MRTYVLLPFCLLAVCAAAPPEAPAVEEVVSSYYAIPAYIDKILRTPNLTEDEIINKLGSRFAEICTDPFLDRIQLWLGQLSIYGSALAEYQESLRLVTPKKLVNITTNSTGSITASYRIQTREVYSMASNLRTIEGFVSKFKVTNISQENLDKIFSEYVASEVIELEVTGDYIDTFILVRQGRQLKISDVKHELVSSMLVVQQ